MSRHPLVEPRRGTGKRWETELHSACKDVEEALEEEPQDIGKMRREMAARKISNTTTSISFGNENLTYVSDAMFTQRQAGAGATPQERADQRANQKAMKKALTTTSFTLGDEPVMYESSNAEGMRTAAAAAKGYRKISMNADLKAAVKKSSLHFGNEQADYKSTMAECMTYREPTNDFASVKAQTELLKKELRKHNFTFGDEKVRYQTDYASGYGAANPEHYKKGDERNEIKKQIEEIRKCHFSLGNDNVEYISDMHRCMEVSANAPAHDVSAMLERARALKAALQQTTITIGDDSEFM